ncbi:Translation elongation factor Ts [Clostridiaceae bacterium JG1575]|nr:Translation elongation factor Ts [Clostridiaceae bacterium JG1575]
MITAQMVKELRDRTGAGMMDSKKALTQADGDMDKAIEILREKGLASVAKKAGRIAAEGVVATYVSEDMKHAGMVEFNCETDFVSLNEEFKKLAHDFAKLAATTEAKDVEAFVQESYENATVQDAISGLIAKIGENMSLRRFVRMDAPDGLVASYIHMGGKIGVLVQLKSETVNEEAQRIAKDVAMHVAATNPAFLTKEEVDQDTLEKEKEIYRVQAKNEGKPDNIVEKMVLGRIQKYYKEAVLLEQPFVKDPDVSVGSYVQNEGKKLGAMSVVRYARFEKGEGIEKKVEDFAAEVAAQMNKA